jgi:7-keto-8-aminopelargonate synthetase-like enzyme
MGTFSKALGSFGGFIAGSNTLIQYLINKARPLIYTTALPPAVLAASYAALQLIQEDEGVELRKKLWTNTHQLRRAVTDLGFNIGDSRTPIIPLRVNDTHLALTFSRRLFEAGIAIPAIRPPTVSKGQSRLRMTVMATHTQAEIACLVHALKEIGCALKII